MELFTCKLVSGLFEFRGSFFTYLFQEYDLGVRLLIICIVELLACYFLFVVRFVVLCVYFDTEEQPMAKYLELKHINQSFTVLS